MANVVALVVLYPLAIFVSGAGAYGFWVLCFSAIQLLTLTDFGLGTGVLRELGKIISGSRSDIGEREFAAVAIWIFALLGAILSFGFVMVFPRISGRFNAPDSIAEHLGILIALATFALMFSVLGRGANAVLWANDRFDIERKASLAALALRAAGIGVAAIFGWGIWGVASAEAASIVIPGLVTFCAVLKRYRGIPVKVSDIRRHGPQLLRTSSALFVGSFAAAIATQLPIYFVAGSLGLQATAAFGGVVRIFQSLRLVASWAANPFSGLVARSSRNLPEIQAIHMRMFRLSIAFAGLSAIPLLVLPEDILRFWLGNDFLFAAPSIAALAVAAAANAFIYPSSILASILGHPVPVSSLNLLWLGLELAGLTLPAARSNIFGSTLVIVLSLLATAPLYVVVAKRAIGAWPQYPSLRATTAYIAMAALIAAPVLVLKLLSIEMAAVIWIVIYCCTALVVGAWATLWLFRARKRLSSDPVVIQGDS